MILDATRMLSLVRDFLKCVLLVPAVIGCLVIVLSLYYWGQAGEVISSSEIGHSLAAYDEPIKLSSAENTISHALFDRDVLNGTLCTPASSLFSLGRKRAGPSNDLARQIFLRPDGPPTFHTIVKQLFTACRLEAEYNDDVLLREWLSRAYFGNGEFGIVAAAQSLFGAMPEELSDDDGYALAALLWGVWLRDRPDQWAKKQEMLKNRSRKATK